MEILEICVSITVVLTALGGLIVFAIVRPLNKSNDDLRLMIGELRDLIAEIRHDLKTSNERVHRLEGEVRELKYSSQKAHDRIDAFLKEAAAHERLGH